MTWSNTSLRCHGRDCDNVVPVTRKWCSERCRKRQYDMPCVDCGARVSGYDGHRDEPRCFQCANRIARDEAKIWTRAAVVLAIQEWAAIYDDPPAVADWDPAVARRINNEARALRWKDADGRWPSANTVRRELGSWAHALAAAGFEPRAPHGGAGNQRRRRSAGALT